MTNQEKIDLLKDIIAENELIVLFPFGGVMQVQNVCLDEDGKSILLESDTGDRF